MVLSVTSELSVRGCGQVTKNSGWGQRLSACPIFSDSITTSYRQFRCYTKKPCFNCFVICLAHAWTMSCACWFIFFTIEGFHNIIKRHHNCYKFVIHHVGLHAVLWHLKRRRASRRILTLWMKCTLQDTERSCHLLMAWIPMLSPRILWFLTWMRFPE